MILDRQSDVLVVLNAPPNLGDHVLDWLVSRPEGSGFTSMPVSGYGANTRELSIAEQVAGSQRRIQFEIQMSSAVVDRFLEEAGSALGTLAIRYWVLPVLMAGHLGGQQDSPSPKR